MERRDYTGRFNRRAAEHVHDDLAKKAKEVARLRAEMKAKFPDAMQEYEEVIATIMAGKISFFSIVFLFSNFFSCSIISSCFQLFLFVQRTCPLIRGCAGFPWPDSRRGRTTRG